MNSHITTTFAPEELGLRNFFKIESPVAAQNKRTFDMLTKFTLSKSKNYI